MNALRCSAWLLMVQISATVKAEEPSGITLQVSVSARGMPLRDLAVWMQPEEGDGRRLDGSLTLFSLSLPAQQRFLLRFECRSCIPEEVMVDTHLPSDTIAGMRYFPVSVILERRADHAFDFAEPTGCIRYRADVADFGYVDAALVPVPPLLEKRMIDLLSRADATVQPVTFEWPNGMEPKRRVRPGRIWLNALLEECGRDDAVYALERGGIEQGHYVGYIRALQGGLKAIGHYADPGLRVPHGDFTFYHRSGGIECAGQFARGVKCGIWRRYTSDGRALPERVYDPRPLAEILLAAREPMNVHEEGAPRNQATAISHQAGMVHRVEDGSAAWRARRPALAEGAERHDPEISDRPGTNELVIERLRISAVRRVVLDGREVEYRRVATYYGAVHYFKDGRPCTEEEYLRAPAR